jgi:hypothetical protein
MTKKGSRVLPFLFGDVIGDSATTKSRSMSFPRRREPMLKLGRQFRMDSRMRGNDGFGDNN